MGEDISAILIAMSSRADELKQQGRFSEAIDLASQVCDKARRYSSSDPVYGIPAYGIALGRLADVYRDAECYQDAIKCYLEVIEIWRKSGSTYSTLMAQSLNNLTEVYLTIGDLNAAMPVCQEAIEAWKKSTESKGRGFVESLDHAAILHYFLGNYSQSKSFFKQAIDAWYPKPFPEDMISYAKTLNNQGELYKEMGDYGTAEALFLKANEIIEKFNVPKSSDLAGILSNLSQLYATLGRYQDAEGLLKKALFIWMENPANVTLYAKGLNNWAELKRARGLYDDLDKYYRKAIFIQENILGKDSLDLASSMNNLAELYRITGRYEEAESLYERALVIMEKSSGTNSSNIASTLDNLASVHLALGKTETAVKEMIRAAEIDDYLISQVLSITSERQKMDFIDMTRLRADGFLSAAIFYGFIPAIIEKSMDLVLRRKAILAEVMAVQRDTAISESNKSLEPKLTELKILRTQIAQKVLAGPESEDLENHEKTIADWIKRKESLEEEIVSSMPELRSKINETHVCCKSVAEALPEGAILIEFFRLHPFDFKAILSRGEPQWKLARYIAFILRAKRPEDVHLVDLGDASVIDGLVSQLRAMLARNFSDPSKPDEQYESICSDLRARCFDPLEAALRDQGVLKDKGKLFISPDGELTQLPFEILPTGNGRYLIDDYRISYLSSGRDLLRFKGQSKKPKPEDIVVMYPNFNLKASNKTSSSRDLSTRQSLDLNPKKIYFEPLNGSFVEAGINAILEVQAWIGNEALEGRVKKVRSPRILHIATHGFFLEDLENIQEKGLLRPLGRFCGPGMENPLLRSGLALAGVNSWLRGDSLPSEAEDGILNAEDVSGMDLLGTEMVVLSACNTGLGDIKVGEGVLGLRRSFVLAGARTLIMSLWKVSDKETSELMIDFYDRVIMEGQCKADALRDAQLLLKSKYPNPAFWGAFICQGDPGKLG